MRFAKTIAGLGLLVALACFAQQPYHNSLTWRANQWVQASQASQFSDQYAFIAVAHATNRYNWSSDGTNWNTATFTNLPGGAFEMVWVNGHYYISPYTDQKPLRNENYTNWTMGPSIGVGSFTRMAFSATNFGVTVYKSTSAAVYSGTNGLNWNSVGPAPGSNPTYTDCIYAQNKFVLMCTKTTSTPASTAIYAVSADGTNWEGRTFPVTRYWQRLAFGANTWVVLPISTNNTDAKPCSSHCLYSADGTNWTIASFPGQGSWEDITFGGGLFVTVPYSMYAGGAFTNICLTSSDGINWGRQTLPAKAGWIYVCYGSGHYVAIAQDSTQGAISNDGTNWASITLANSLTWTSIAAKP